MAAEEDKKFDAVLGGFLVNDLRARAGHLLCPESEVLAAYHERSLLPEEMNSWKEHIVACSRCQAILAELEATDSIPLPVNTEEEAVMTVAAPVSAATRDRDAAQSRLPGKARSPRPIRGPRWLWLAPAGALAAGLLVWVAWHEEKPQLPGSSEVKIAKVQEPITSAPPVARQDPAAPSSDQLPSDQLPDHSKARDAIGGLESSKVLNESGSLKQQGKFDSRTRGAPAKPSAEKESALRKDGDRYSSPALLRDENRLALDAKDAEAAPTEKLEMQGQAANIQSQNQVISPRVPGPAPLSQAEQSKKTKSDSAAHNMRLAAPPAAPRAPEPAAGFAGGATTQVAAFSNPHLITAPGEQVLWRAGRAGVIEFSTDNGASWTRQTSGVLVDLTTGSAPSAKVCWIVGRVGAVLLTTDGGEHWAVIHSPLDEDLGGVRAVDALHATIWNLRNTKTFETSDGGITWKPAASE